MVFAVRPLPSNTVSVMVVTPLYTDFGVIVTEHTPAALGPTSTMPVVGIRAVLLEADVMVSDAAGVIASPTVNASADVDVPILMS